MFKVVHILERFDYCDGCARSVHTLLLMQKQRGYSVSVITSGGDALSLLLRDHIPVVVIPQIAHAGRSMLRFLSGAWHLHDHLKASQPDVVHAHHYYCANQVRLFSRSLRTRLVFTAHALIPRWGRLPLYVGEHIVAVSQAIKDDAVKHHGIPACSITVIYNALQAPARSSLRRSGVSKHASGRLVVTFIGRLVREKGVHVLLDALRRLKRPERIRAVFTGTGPEETRLRELVAQWDIPVEFSGVLADVAPAFAKSDIIVVPSIRWEGLPMVILEAGMAGKCVITTAIPGITELIENGRNGLLVPPDDPQSLAEGISALAEDKSSRVRLGKALHQTVKLRASPERLFENVRAVYEGLPVR